MGCKINRESRRAGCMNKFEQIYEEKGWHQTRAIAIVSEETIAHKIYGEQI